jgi:2-polyprenyl-3-methyl-5-hydroxy-6-metoxy-1,4-benzoquinol methylase
MEPVSTPPVSSKPNRDGRIVIEKGIVAGNVTDKYSSANPIHRYLMDGFLKQVEEFVRTSGCKQIYEVGCGEGLLSLTMSSRIKGLRIRGSDFSTQVVETAQSNSAGHGGECEFSVADVYSLTSAEHGAELVMCCEVLEHLERPEEALKILASLASKHVIVSVPNEPLWRVLNFARGKYISDWGNTPGHLNHWSPGAFRKFLETELVIEEMSCPLPWTVVLAKPRRLA